MALCLLRSPNFTPGSLLTDEGVADVDLTLRKDMFEMRIEVGDRDERDINVEKIDGR